MTWSRGMMIEDVISMIIGIQTAGEICLTFKKTMLPLTIEQESWLKDNLYSLRKVLQNLKIFSKNSKAYATTPMPSANQCPTKIKFFNLLVLSNPQFILALQNHEQTIIAQREDLVPNQNLAFLSGHGRGRNQQGGWDGYGRGSSNNGGRQNGNQHYNQKPNYPQNQSQNHSSQNYSQKPKNTEEKGGNQVRKLCANAAN